MEELTLEQEIEVIALRVQRRELLSEEPLDDTGMKLNLKKRLIVSGRLFELTRNPIYIHF
jgi:hypothetical protein